MRLRLKGGHQRKVQGQSTQTHHLEVVPSRTDFISTRESPATTTGAVEGDIREKEYDGDETKDKGSTISPSTTAA